MPFLSQEEGEALLEGDPAHGRAQGPSGMQPLCTDSR